MSVSGACDLGTGLIAVCGNMLQTYHPYLDQTIIILIIIDRTLYLNLSYFICS